MSEMETTPTTVEPPRNPSGQFTGSEEKFGIQGVEADQGFTHVKTEAAPLADDSPEAVYEDFKRKRGDLDNSLPLVRELTYADTGEKVEPNLAITAEQAHAALTQSYSFENAARELLGIEQLQDQIDKARAEKIKGDPKLAEHYGVELPPDETVVEKKAAKGVEAGEESAELTTPGLAPEVEEALKLPQVREAIEQELGRAQHVQQHADTALQTANYLGQSIIAVQFPEMLGGDPVAAFNHMAATNPQRAQACLQVLDTAAQMEAQQQQHQQRHAQQVAWQEQQQFKSYKADQEQLFEKGTDVARAEWPKYAKALGEHAKKFGLDVETIYREAQTNYALNHAAFQTLMIDGLRYQEMKRAPAKAIPKAVPAVQKPGVARSVNERSSDDVTGLRQKLSASGNVEDAFALYSKKRGRK